ncbi:hypothetical protein CB1_000262002 [Camelus ferus]|nr:hypothetical protein CB1_000262002 [Camelus ferus]
MGDRGASAEALGGQPPGHLLLTAPAVRTEPPPDTAKSVRSVTRAAASVETQGATSSLTASPASAAVTSAAASVASSASKTASPLEHILQTLFGKKKSFDPPTKEPAESAPASHQDSRAKAEGLPAAPLLDPIVQQFGQFSKDKALEEEEDDRPYDPEEEYGPERAFDTQLGAENALESAEREEVAYDPEDETILEEAKVTIDDLPNRMCVDAHGGCAERPAGFTANASAPSLVEQQKMIEELNKQIEEQKRQVEEQEAALRQQRAAVGAAPEDETILEEAKVTIDDLPNRMCVDAHGGCAERPAGFTANASAPSLVEQQKMIEELNKQSEEQKRQVEEQEAALRQQRAAVGASMAHFSVSDALMSPPPKASLPRAQLRRIRICCDELNLLVPFCNAETDKATTLQWTTAFLKYIQERHGDSLKKEPACTCTRTYTHTCRCIYTHTQTCTHTHNDTHTYSHTHTYTCTHTHSDTHTCLAAATKDVEEQREGLAGRQGLASPAP